MYMYVWFVIVSKHTVCDLTAPKHVSTPLLIKALHELFHYTSLGHEKEGVSDFVRYTPNNNNDSIIYGWIMDGLQ